MECYRLAVPETRGSEDGRMLPLGVYVMKSYLPSTKPPIVMLLGGPGGTADSTVAALGWHPTRIWRDVIILEQRGVGVSANFCADYPEYWYQNVAFVDDEDQQWEIALQGLEDCFDEARARGIRVESYNTTENAADVADLRQALKLEELDIWAVSYGTALAQAYIELEPGRVRRALFDGTVDIEVNLAQRMVPSFLMSLEAAWTDCTLEELCNETETTFTDRLLEQITSYNEKPLKLDIEDLDYPWGFSGSVEGSDILTIVHSNLYLDYSHTYLPHLFDQIEARSNLTIVSELKWLSESWISDGMFYATRCHMPRASAQEIAEVISAHGLIAEEFYLEDLNTICERIGIGSNPSLESYSEVFDGQILIISGRTDPITPLNLALGLRDRYPGATYLNIPFGGHGPSYSLPCGQDIAANFFNRGEKGFARSCDQRADS